MKTIIVGIITCSVCLGILGLSSCKKSVGQEQEKVELKMPTGTPKRPQGMKALTSKGGNEPFSKADVTTYFKVHGLPRSQTPKDQIQVESLEFMTSADVTQRLQGVSTGLAATDRVGFATLKGAFLFTGPKQSKPATFDRAYAVFDASTGNLLMVGTLDGDNSGQPNGPR